MEKFFSIILSLVLFLYIEILMVSRLNSEIVKTLISWQKKEARNFPWRTQGLRDPYKVWICEIMSQQSTMTMMLPFYKKWMKVFPDLDSLSKASEQDVVSLWQGLGYYSRARNILKTANILKDDYKGVWPQSSLELKKFPGIGDYTAKAIAAFCFDEKSIPIDGNVVRVMSRVFSVKDALNNSSDKKKLLNKTVQLEASLKKGQSGILAEALMDLGSGHCHSKKEPQCHLCPLGKKSLCALKNNDLCFTKFPLPKKRAEKIVISRLMLFYYRDKTRQHILLRQRPKGARKLAGFWEAPYIDFQGPWVRSFQDRLSDSFEFLEAKPIKHGITRYQYNIKSINAGVWRGKCPESHCFVSLKDIDLVQPISTQSLKVLENTRIFS